MLNKPLEISYSAVSIPSTVWLGWHRNAFLGSSSCQFERWQKKPKWEQMTAFAIQRPQFVLSSSHFIYHPGSFFIWENNETLQYPKQVKNDHKLQKAL